MTFTFSPGYYFFQKVLFSLLHPCWNIQERVLSCLQSCSDHGPWNLLLLESSVLIPHHQRNFQERGLNLVLLQPITLWPCSLNFTTSRKFWLHHPTPSETPRRENLFQFFKKSYSEPQRWPLLLLESLSSSTTTPKERWWGGFLQFSFHQSSSDLTSHPQIF